MHVFFCFYPLSYEVILIWSLLYVFFWILYKVSHVTFQSEILFFPFQYLSLFSPDLLHYLEPSTLQRKYKIKKTGRVWKALLHKYRPRIAILWKLQFACCCIFLIYLKFHEKEQRETYDGTQFKDLWKEADRLNTLWREYFGWSSWTAASKGKQVFSFWRT